MGDWFRLLGDPFFFFFNLFGFAPFVFANRKKVFDSLEEELDPPFRVCCSLHFFGFLQTDQLVL